MEQEASYKRQVYFSHRFYKHTEQLKNLINYI